MSQATRSIDYRNKKALVVDDYPSMRTAFKMALASFGMTKVDVAASAAEAIGRVKTVVYDIIICDYNLGEGRDGQQLLEEMRHDYLIGLETVFLMVTAESVYQRVVAAAELAPDDYLIKPFNGEILRTRLDAILAKKEAFADVYRNFANEDLEASMAACDVLMKQQPKYFVDALRFKGEILIAMGNFEGAEAIYRQVTAMRAVPWSRLCLARALHLQRKEAAAEEILLDLVEQNPELVASYDLLADVQVAQNKLGDAQSTLQRGVEVSGKSPRRQRRLGEVAYQNNDLKTAETAFRAAVDKGRNSIFQGANDFANLCRVHLDQGDTKAAAEVIAKNRKLLQESDEGKLVSAVVLGQINERNGRYGEARTQMTEAAALLRRGIQCEPEMALGMVETCVKVGMDEEAAEVLSEVARNGHDSAALLEKAKRIYQEAGKEAAVAQILQQSTERVATLSREGALLLQRGDLKNGVAKLLLAATEAPRNPRVLMNTTWAIVRLIEQDGDSGDMLAQAKRLLDDVAYLAPGHPRLADLRTSLRNIGSQRTA